jgi:hypothetical protein
VASGLVVGDGVDDTAAEECVSGDKLGEAHAANSRIAATAGTNRFTLAS